MTTTNRLTGYILGDNFKGAPEQDMTENWNQRQSGAAT